MTLSVDDCSKFSISIDVQTFVSSYCRIILPHTKALYITTNETLQGIIDDVDARYELGMVEE